MDSFPISLQMMDPNCKPVHARAYIVPRSVEQQDWWKLESLKTSQPIPLNRHPHFHHLQFLRKTEQ
jgi:hypothetical protein